MRMRVLSECPRAGQLASARRARWHPGPPAALVGRLVNSISLGITCHLESARASARAGPAGASHHGNHEARASWVRARSDSRGLRGLPTFRDSRRVSKFF